MMHEANAQTHASSNRCMMKMNIMQAERLVYIKKQDVFCPVIDLL